MKEKILASEGCLASQIEAVKNSIAYLGGNNYIFHNNTVTTSIPIPKDPVVAIAPPPPSYDFLLVILCEFHVMTFNMFSFFYIICFGLNYVDVVIF